LLEESEYQWSTNYPKHKDLSWKLKTDDGWIISKEPMYDGTMNFTSFKDTYDWYKTHPPLESYAKEVSREKHLTTS